MTTRLSFALLALAACSDREPVEPAPTLLCGDPVFSLEMPALEEIGGKLLLGVAASVGANALPKQRAVHGLSLLLVNQMLRLSGLPIYTLYLPAFQTANFLSVLGCPELCASVVRELATRTGAPADNGGNKDC